jgi:hypothetical protein
MSEEKIENSYEIIDVFSDFIRPEIICFECPHCGKDVIIEIKRDLFDESGMAKVWWGKDYKEIKDKQRKYDEWETEDE